MAKYEVTGDDVFDQFLANKQAQEAAAAARKAKKGSGDTIYEQPEWLGLSKEKARLVRFVGKPFVQGGYRNPTDAVELYVAKIKDDEGKIMYLYLPLRDDEAERDHLMWKIIDDVNHKEWIQKKLVAVNEANHPDIFKLVNKGGYTEQDGKFPYMYATGWKGKKVLIANVIDRDNDWCVTNKHTKLLSKAVNEGLNKDGNPITYAEVGVPAYAFDVVFADLFKKDRNWENYDVSILATGDKNNAYKIINCSKSAALAKKLAAAEPGYNQNEMLSETYLAEDQYDKIVVGPLSESELDYDRYDLDKLFHVTSYRSINKRLGNSIKKIDAALNTHYYDKLQEYVAFEEEEYNKNHPKTNDTTEEVKEEAVVPNFDSAEKVQEVMPTRSVVNNSLKYEILKGYSALTAEQKNQITDVDATGNITWSENTKSLAPCDKCGCSFPSDWTMCPKCAQKYEIN